MDRERLTRLLEDPGMMDRTDLDGLRDMTARDPWFTAGHLLLAAGVHALGDVHYDSTLNTSAAHLPSRSALFDVVHGRTEVRTTLRILREEPTPPKDTARVDQRPTLGMVPEAAEVPSIDPVVPGPEASDPLDEEIRRAALMSSYELLLEHAPKEVLAASEDRVEGNPPFTELSEVRADKPNAPVAVLPSDVPNSLPATSTETAIPAAAKVTSTSRMRFTQWLDQAHTLVHDTQARQGPQHGSGPVPMLPVEGSRTDTEEDTTALIDRFIQQANPEPKAKAAFFTPQQAGKRSLDDSDGLVTETLARIYEKQGNTVKAIDAYRKLALKYPDKSAYFAALSKALEEQ